MRTLRSNAGFTLIEMLVAVSIFVVASTMAMVVTNSVVPSIRADGQARRVVALLQYAREVAIASRRNVQVQFDLANNTLTIMRMDAGLATPLETLVFEFSMRFEQMPGLGDTPDSYGAAAVVDFGGAQNLIFEPDGTFIDETGLPLNGTIFLGIQGRLQTARAITVTGTTARARVYRWNQAGWWAPQ